MNIPEIKSNSRPQDLSFNEPHRLIKGQSSQPALRLNDLKPEMRQQSKRLELLTKINDLSKKVESVELRLLEKLKHKSSSLHTSGVKRLNPNPSSKNLPHPLILANLISAFYGTNSNATRSSKAKYHKGDASEIEIPAKTPFLFPSKIRKPKLEIHKMSDQIILQKKRFPASIASPSIDSLATKENLPSTNTIVNLVNSIKIPKDRQSVKQSSSVSISELQDKNLSGENNDDRSFTDSGSPQELDPIPEHPAFGSVIMKNAIDIKPRASQFSRMEINLVVERSEYWSKLANTFRFIVALKKTYQERLHSRKSLCETFYTENYDFVVQSIVMLIKKPIQDAISQLLDIKRNFDVVSEIEVSRITTVTIISLRVS